MLLPALARAKEQDRCIKCLSNLRQINLGYTASVGDDNGLLGWGVSGGANLGVGGDMYAGSDVSTGAWFEKTWGSDQLSICPDASQGPGPPFKYSIFWLQGTVNSAWQMFDVYRYWPPEYWGGGPGSGPTNRAGSYAGNDWVGHWRLGGNLSQDYYVDYVWTKETQILHPAKTPVFADGVNFWACWPLESDFPAIDPTGSDGLENF